MKCCFNPWFAILRLSRLYSCIFFWADFLKWPNAWGLKWKSFCHFSKCEIWEQSEFSWKGRRLFRGPNALLVVRRAGKCGYENITLVFTRRKAASGEKERETKRLKDLLKLGWKMCHISMVFIRLPDRFLFSLFQPVYTAMSCLTKVAEQWLKYV